jgi:hypothetical protein
MELPSIDSRYLSRAKHLKPGIKHAWFTRNKQDHAHIEIKVLSRNEIRLIHATRDGSETIQTPVRLVDESCKHGRNHTWFQCPSCQRVTALLYLQADQFKCGQCHGVPNYHRRKTKLHDREQKQMVSC